MSATVISRDGTLAEALSRAALVLGPSAGEYRFTSALPVQILKTMAPLLKPTLNSPPGSSESCPATP